MDAAYVSAFAALAGATLGGLTSFATLMDNPTSSSQGSAARAQANGAEIIF
jgi:hypothetical protein